MSEAQPARTAATTADALTDLDRRIVELTQGGLPLVSRPYHQIADTLGVEAELVMERVRRMQETGAIRRIAAVPNHYKLGFRGNGMSVWDIPDDRVNEVGARIGALDYVSHCYIRPRALPDWRYNLFAMVHGRDRDAVFDQIAEIVDLLGDRVRAYDVLFSTQILKKTGFRGSASSR